MRKIEDLPYNYNLKIAICIIAFNRIDSLKRLLNSLEKAHYDNPVDLIISIDKSDTNIVEEFAFKYQWRNGEKKVITYQENLGLRKHVLKCGNFLNELDALIVLEDDVSVAPSYYYYAKQCINQYINDDNIAGISLYNFPVNYQNGLPFTALHSDSDVYLMQCAQSWGQIWLKKQWFSFIEWYNKHQNDEFENLTHLPKAIRNWPKSSWLKFHTRYCIEENKYFVYPYTSLSTNNADIGTHYTNKTTIFQSNLLYGVKQTFKLTPSIYYDGFFENELIYKILDKKKEELCVNFYGQKDSFSKKRYLLTRKKLNYHIIKSYSLSFKPYELNIVNDNKGQELFLYDTSRICKNKFISIGHLFNLYMYNHDLNVVSLIKEKIKTTIRKCFLQ